MDLEQQQQYLINNDETQGLMTPHETSATQNEYV